jgi:hypothetical protein
MPGKTSNSINDLYFASAIRTLHPFWDNFRIAGNPGEAIEHSRKCKAENDQREEHRRTFFTLADILE